MSKRLRVAFVNSHPIQYVAPLYEYLDRSPDIEPVALYLTDFSLRGAVDSQFGREVVWDVDLLEGYEYHFVGPSWTSDVPAGFFSLRGGGLWKAIRHGKFDAVVLHGHQYLANMVALAAARMSGIPVFYKAETHLALPASAAKAALRPALLRMLFTQISGFLAIGTRNRNFYESLKVPKEKISFYPYTVDNERYTRSSTLGDEARARIRRELGLSSDGTVILYASKFMHRKHPDHLIRAAQRLAREGNDCELLMVGTGEMEGHLKAIAAEEKKPAVRFPGFINQRDLPSIMAACDIFVLPSENEPFGLIVNEAMCAGLPVVVASEIGCVGDLVRPGENGFVFEAGDITGLADALRSLVTSPAIRLEMGRRSRQIIAGWSFEQNLHGLRHALTGVGLDRHS